MCCCPADAGSSVATYATAARLHDQASAHQVRDLAWAETKAQLESLRALHSKVFGEQGYIGPEAADKLISSWYRPAGGGQKGAATQPGPAAEPATAAAAGAEEAVSPGSQGAEQGGRGAEHAEGAGGAILEAAARMCDDVFETIAGVAAPLPMAAAGGSEHGSPAGAGTGAEEEEGDPETSRIAGVDFSEMPHALKAIAVLRLALPLRLALAAYRRDEEGFRQATGISAVRLVDDATYDAQASAPRCCCSETCAAPASASSASSAWLRGCEASCCETNSPAGADAARAHTPCPSQNAAADQVFVGWLPSGTAVLAFRGTSTERTRCST